MNGTIIENQANSAVTSEMKNAINNKANQFSDSRLTTAAVFAFLPYFGIIGVHNFILKQYKKGIAHIAIVILCYMPYIIVSASCDYGSNCYDMVMLTMFLQYLAVASYIWAIVEGIQILQSKKQKVSSLSTTSNSNTIQTPKPIMDAGNTSYFVANQPSPETVAKIEQEKKQDRKVWSILSIVATIIPIMLWVYCLIVSGGSGSENGPGAVWWLMVIYYWSLGIPLAAISIAFGIVGLKTSLRWLSIISLLLKAMMIITIVLLLFVHQNRPNWLGY